MTDSQVKEWPEYFPGGSKRGDLVALGVISLNYIFLENIFRSLFATAIGMTEKHAMAVFQRIPNNNRLTILDQLLPSQNWPDDLKDLIAHFKAGFEICAANRHDIMHSAASGMFVAEDREGTVLSKYLRSGDQRFCFVTLDELKKVADDIHAYGTFGAFVISDLTGYITRRARGDEATFRPASSRHKPPEPKSLRWLSPEAAQDAFPRPGSSPG